MSTSMPFSGDQLVWAVVNNALNTVPYAPEIVGSARIDPSAVPGPQDSKRPRLFDATRECEMLEVADRGITNREYFLELGRYIAAQEASRRPDRKKEHETDQEFDRRRRWFTAKYMVSDVFDDHDFSIDELNAIFEMGLWSREHGGLLAWINPQVCSIGDLLLLTNLAQERKAEVAVRSTVSKAGELKDDVALNLSPLPALKGEVSLLASLLNSVLGGNVKTLWKVRMAQTNAHDARTHEAYEKARDSARSELSPADHVGAAFGHRAVRAIAANGSLVTMAKWSPNWDAQLGWVRIPDEATDRQRELAGVEISRLLRDPRTREFADAVHIELWQAAAWGALAFRDFPLARSLAENWGIEDQWTLLYLFSGREPLNRMISGPTASELLTSQGRSQLGGRFSQGFSRTSSRVLGLEASGGAFGKAGPTLASLLFFLSAIGFLGLVIFGIFGWVSVAGYFLWGVLSGVALLFFLSYWRRARHHSGSGPRVLLIVAIVLLAFLLAVVAVRVAHPREQPAPITTYNPY